MMQGDYIKSSQRRCTFRIAVGTLMMFLILCSGVASAFPGVNPVIKVQLIGPTVTTLAPDTDYTFLVWLVEMSIDMPDFSNINM